MRLRATRQAHPPARHRTSRLARYRKGHRALNATDVTTFFGHIKFATDPAHHGLQAAHEMVLAQWQKTANGQLTRQVVWPKAAQSADLVYPITEATH